MIPTQRHSPLPLIIKSKEIPQIYKDDAKKAQSKELGRPFILR